ncbi:MAG: hypothetical protein V1728_06275 [Candidatus Micrarchaeota archaeon]
MKIKIEIIDRKTMRDKDTRDIEAARPQEEDYILSFESMDAFNKVFSNKRVDMMKVIREKKPKSLFALARILGRDFKNVHSDARMLEANRLISLKKVKNGKRVSLKPVSKADKIEFKMAI